METLPKRPQVYLCTEGRIVAHADVDMSRLLSREGWLGRSTSEFGRTGMEGDFQLHLPGEPSAPGEERRHAGHRPAVVTIGAELARVDSAPGGPALSDAGGAELELELADRGGEGEIPGVTTWAYLAPKRQRRGVITAALERLQLRPAPTDGGGDGGGRGAGRVLNEPLEKVLVGIHAAMDFSSPVGAATAAEGRGGVPVSEEGFRVVGCGERGAVDMEGSSLLETITWKWEGELPGGGEGPGRPGGSHRALAAVRVLRSGAGGGEVATGEVPWPSSDSGGGGEGGRRQQHVDVKLVSPQGSEVGSCRVCLFLVEVAVAAGGAGDERLRQEEVEGAPVEEDGEGEEEGSGREEGFDGTVPGQRLSAGVGRASARTRGAGAAVSTKSVQVEELPLEGERAAAGGAVPRSYRLSVNLASVKDLENAAYVVSGPRGLLEGVGSRWLR